MPFYESSEMFKIYFLGLHNDFQLGIPFSTLIDIGISEIPGMNDAIHIREKTIKIVLCL